MRRLLRIAGAAALLVFLVAGLARLRFDTDVLALLPPDLPTVRALQLQQRHLENSRELFITLRGAEPDQVEESARSLALELRGVPGLVRWAFWRPPWEERPDLATELLAAAWLNADPAEVAALARRLEPEPLRTRLEETRLRLSTSLSPADLARSGYDPLGLTEVPGMEGLGSEHAPRFASEDGRLRLIVVTPPATGSGYRDAIAWLGRVQEALDRWKAGDAGRADLRIRLTGGPVFTAEIASGMERDMRGSAAGTAVIIALLFAWAHRRLRPLLLLLALLAATLLATLGAGGWIFGRLNAVSLGFAAIVLGLVVDYALVLHQERLQHPEASAADIRRLGGPGVVWGAVTTAAAFGALALGGLPGLVQMGILTALGSLFGAGLMLAVFPLLRNRGTPRPPPPARAILRPRAARLLLGLLLAVVPALLAFRGWPRLDTGAEALRPRQSEAYAAMDELRHALGSGAEDPWWLIATGPDERAVARQLHTAEQLLTQAASRAPGAVHQLPLAVWPDPDRQASNRAALGGIAADPDRLRDAVRAAGFTDDAFQAAARVLDTWRNASAQPGVFWPGNEVSAWALAQVAARPAPAGTAPEFLALGFLRPPNRDADAARTRDTLREAGLLVGGWSLLGAELLGRVESRLPWVCGVVVAVWLGSLGLTFRTVRDVLLAAGTVAGTLGLLVAAMAALGWRWNLMNLMALPLIVGAGTDYAIHILLALRRHHGDLAEVQRGTGRAVLLCAATTVVGFGSLAWSGNEGLASLGALCATGLAGAYLLAVHVLPAVWLLGTPAREGAPPSPPGATTGPSSLYAATLWRLATALAARVPRPVLDALAAAGAVAYAAGVPRRRHQVADNLLPLVGHDPAAARRAAWRAFAAFGRKLADLWAYESGRDVVPWITTFTGWEHVTRAREGGRGVLLLTVHLGNWEFGAPLLAARGIRLLVLTLAEPGQGFTELRVAARARWGIETLVIGSDPFAFVEVIRRLQEGAVVALLVDRPPAPTAVTVRLFDRPFAASIAGAELARASGCVLLPTAIVRTGATYAAHVAPPVPYDRRALGARPARVELTQDILRAFEPWLLQHPEQWFHFVPVWPAPAAAPGAPPPSSSPPPS